jgi:hypothetical protein
MRVRFHSEHASLPEIGATTVRSSVHVLRNEEELREAVERAAAFHKRTATLLHARSDHYEAILAAPIDLPACQSFGHTSLTQ